MEKSRKIGLIILIIILIYSISFGGFFYYLTSSAIQIIESIRIPNGYFNMTLDPEDPHIELPYQISNPGIYEIFDLEIDMELNVKFLEKLSTRSLQLKVFEKLERIGKLNSYMIYNDKIIGEFQDFNQTNLNFFDDFANFSCPIEYLINLEIKGEYFYHQVPFKIEFNNIQLYKN